MFITTPPVAPAPWKPALPAVLSLTAGYVDTAGFLALQGLFTAHVTGNFVTLGAALVIGATGAVAKLLALPMFCVVIVLTRLLSYRLPSLGLPVLRTLLVLTLVLLIVSAALAIGLGPFPNGDHATALITGMTLVSAMAIQNAVHRIHLAAAPPTTLMTGTTTQIMIDVADTLRGLAPDARAATRARLRRMAISVVAFAAGCAAAALLYATITVWCFLIPPVLAGYAVYLDAPER
ncbi:DUF1275 family protein [Beijerinckia sp. L45]|uniref:DUF1275 family protein n=1 Tax=Beijerinckia sp. L45 TaxID=1641855 RepID=UPI00131CEC88|nr:DUF1275 family protein [Beijerinckia sp. L45]